MADASVIGKVPCGHKTAALILGHVMRWPGLGAVIGSCVGLVLIGLLILLPRARQNSFYEVSDALLVMGIPLLILGTAVGALVGGALGPTRRGSQSQPTRRSTVTLVVMCLLGCVLAVWLFLWGTGFLNALR